MCTIDRGVDCLDCLPLHQKLKSMTIEQKLGTEIMMRRRQMLISQEDFARMAGINRSYMSSIENGKRVVSVAIIERIARTLGVPISELFRGIEEGMV